VLGSPNPPGGGDTDQRLDHNGKDYFADLWALACDRVATTTDHGATAPQSPALTFPLKVPADSFFALGDNRVASSDSRSFGPQPDDRIIGKVIVRFWPFDRLRFFEW